MDLILLVTGIIVVVEMCILAITRRYDKFKWCVISDGEVLSFDEKNNTVYVKYNINGFECVDNIEVKDSDKYKEGMKCFVFVNSMNYKVADIKDKMTDEEQKKFESRQIKLSNLDTKLAACRMILYFLMLISFYYYIAVGRR